MPNISIHYDELWKDAVENLFPHFIKLIAPDFYSYVNWSKPISFLDQELHQISPKSEETKRFVDRLVRVWMLNGEERWVLVHVEVQGYRETEFLRRMFIYFYRIYDKFNRDILSIAVFADPDLNRIGSIMIFSAVSYPSDIGHTKYWNRMILN